MEAIIIFLSSFFGSFSAFFLYHYFKRPIDTISQRQRLSGALHGLTGKKKTPRGTVLHSPTPEEEQKEKWEEFKKMVEDRRQKVTEDYRKL